MNQQQGRVVMHLDMDAFFVNVELLESPELQGVPIIVAPQGPRAVVCSSSYEARIYGVRSGMPLSRALSLCPAAVVMPLRGNYRYYSQAVMDILRAESPLVEQVSVDEAFVDLTGAVIHGTSPVDIAQRVRSRIAEELHLPSSAGISVNKLIAKMASTGSKPNGLWVVPPAKVREFLDPLPVSKLWGVGSKSTAALGKYGITTIAGLRELDISWLRARFGRAAGEHLWATSRGLDSRDVVPYREEKSIGAEHTFGTDTTAGYEITDALRSLSFKVGIRLRRARKLAGSLSLKIRYEGFETHTKSVPLSVSCDSGMEIYRASHAALRGMGLLVFSAEQSQEYATRAIRLIGVRAEKLERSELGVQYPLFDDAILLDLEAGSKHLEDTVGDDRFRVGAWNGIRSAPDWSAVEHALDSIRQKFTDAAVSSASDLSYIHKSSPEKQKTS